MTHGLASFALVAILAVAVGVTIWLWRDMRERHCPTWLRLLVLVTMFVSGVGFIIWLIDLRIHPHDPSLSTRDILLQRYISPDVPWLPE